MIQIELAEIFFYEYTVSELGPNLFGQDGCILASLIFLFFLFFCFFFFFKISALRFSYLYFLCSLTALDFALIKKRHSMLLILKNCGEERKIVRVGTPGQRPVISRKAL